MPTTAIIIQELILQLQLVGVLQILLLTLVIIQVAKLNGVHPTTTDQIQGTIKTLVLPQMQVNRHLNQMLQVSLLPHLNQVHKVSPTNLLDHSRCLLDSRSLSPMPLSLLQRPSRRLRMAQTHGVRQEVIWDPISRHLPGDQPITTMVAHLEMDQGCQEVCHPLVERLRLRLHQQSNNWSS